MLANLYCANDFHHLYSKAAKRDDTLLRKNMEKKAKWRAEVETDLEAAAAKAQ